MPQCETWGCLSSLSFLHLHPAPHPHRLLFKLPPIKCVNSSGVPDRRHLPLSSLSPALHAPGETDRRDTHKTTCGTTK